MNDVTELVELTYGLGRRTVPPGTWRRLLRKAIHFFSYHLILKRHTTRMTQAAGFRLIVRPTVFHPRCFITSEFFASYIGRLDLRGKRVADVGTGSGILALAAARAGAANVTAIDINPTAALTAADNARANGLGDRFTAVCANLFAGLAPGAIFDVIISSPPSFPGEPRDIADRAWYAGPNYRAIAPLFHQARALVGDLVRQPLVVNARSLDGRLGSHPVIDDVEDRFEHRRDDARTARAAEHEENLAVLLHQGRGHRGERPLAGNDSVRLA